MTDRTRLAPLLQVSRLLLDARLAELERSARACAETRARLADLEHRPSADDLPLAAAERARIAYEIWAEARRADMNLVLARQTAEWLVARDEARRAFGRVDVLARLSGKHG